MGFRPLRGRPVHCAVAIRNSPSAALGDEKAFGSAHWSAMPQLARTLLRVGAMVHAHLVSRLIDPLSHPFAALGGGAAFGGLVDGEAATTIIRVSWRLLRLLLAL